MRLSFLLALGIFSISPLACSSPADTGSGGGSTTTDGGAGGTGGTGGGGEGGGVSCNIPTETVPLSVPSDPDDPNAVKEADGTFGGTADGFTVTTAAETISVFGVQPAVPDGTLVHITYAETQGFYGPPGAFVLLENLPTLGGNPNPTEAGTRVWYFAASQGGDPAAMAPFSPAFDELCGTGQFPDGINDVLTLTLGEPGATVTVLPGQEGTFTVGAGEDAGAYSAENVNIQFVGAPGGDAWSITNFTVARAD